MRLYIYLFLFVGSLFISGLITFIFIETGFDWSWAKFFNENEAFVWMSTPAVLGGMFIPFVIIGYSLINHKRKSEFVYKIQFVRSLYAFITTYVVMTVLKVFTNRVDMEPFEPIGNVDFSDQFRFGFMNSNSWWESFSEGWPSGHTMIAVGMAIAIHPLLQSKFWKNLNLIYPIIVGLSVSTAFHWVSDVVSGALIGIVIGLFFAKLNPRS